MKMTKASEADLEMAIELANALEVLSCRWGGVMPDKISKPQRKGDETEGFSLGDAEQCRRVCEYLIKLTRSASLFRVAMGMIVLLDPANNVVDPDADTLEQHPFTKTAKQDSLRLEWAMRNVTGLGWGGAGVEYAANCTRSDIDAAMLAQGELVSG
jgi:hypothetical protein